VSELYFSGIIQLLCSVPASASAGWVLDVCFVWYDVSGEIYNPIQSQILCLRDIGHVADSSCYC
jgi:hypothetical protein